jgi:hypothetical protein
MTPQTTTIQVWEIIGALIKLVFIIEVDIEEMSLESIEYFGNIEISEGVDTNSTIKK